MIERVEPKKSKTRIALILRLVVLAAATAATLPSSAAENRFPWKAGDNPPQVAGVVLGDTEQRVLGLLGHPGSVSAMGDAEVLEYPKDGLEISSTAADGVSIIRLRTSKAGAIDGVRIGDDVRTVLAKWGRPDVANGPVALYNAGVWTVEIRLATTTPNVVDILLAWNTTKWPNADMSKGQYYRPQ